MSLHIGVHQGETTRMEISIQMPSAFDFFCQCLTVLISKFANKWFRMVNAFYLFIYVFFHLLIDLFIYFIEASKMWLAEIGGSTENNS